VSSVIQATQLSKSYQEGRHQLTVLHGINFTVTAGEFVAITGTSGSGKSTLLHLLGGLDAPSAGTVTVMGQSLYALSDDARGTLRNQHLGFVYQFHHLLPEFSALENVMMPLLIRGDKTKEARAQATELLVQVGLGKRLAHKPSALSGGERQRAAIARALVTSPSCLLADEPTGNLDKHTAEQVMSLLKTLNREQGASIVMVTHDQQLAAQADRVVVLDEGRLVETADG